MTPDTAMIFAAGFGTRMGALTKDLPKPMLKLGDRPMIDHGIQLLRDAGISRLFANTHYLPEKLEAHLETRGVITFREDTILETGGGLKAALSRIGEGPVITMNPDALWLGPNPVKALLSAWSEHMTALLLLVRDKGEEPSDFSLEHGEISRNGPFRYTGLQILRTARLQDIDEGVFSLNRYWDHLLGMGPIHGVLYDGDWMDIGTAAGLETANRRLNA